jgi:hypothetical protein
MSQSGARRPSILDPVAAEIVRHGSVWQSKRAAPQAWTVQDRSAGLNGLDSASGTIYNHAVRRTFRRSTKERAMVVKNGRTVTFVYRPDQNACRDVALAGSFNDWKPDQGKMTRQKDGTYRKRLTLGPGEYRYKFVVDSQWVEDPQAETETLNEFGTKDSVVRV